MSNHQVLLQGGNWKKQFLICILLIVVGLIILHQWRPGTISAILADIYDSLVSLFHYIGNFIDYLQEKI